MTTSSEHPERVPGPRMAARPRRHNTFAVLRRAQAAVDRAELVLDIAHETVCHTDIVMTRLRCEPLIVLDEPTRVTLRALLG